MCDEIDFLFPISTVAPLKFGPNEYFITHFVIYVIT